MILSLKNAYIRGAAEALGTAEAPLCCRRPVPGSVPGDSVH